MPNNRIILFGDADGISQIVRHVPKDCIVGIVAASIRPQYYKQIKEIADEFGAQFIVQPKVTIEGQIAYVERMLYFISVLKDTTPDLYLVNSYSMYIPDSVLEIPKNGAINTHGALLPQYRGANPIQWALINNEKETGVTMHKMTNKFDQGEIIAQKRVPIHFTDTWITIQNRIRICTDRLFVEEIPKILQGNTTGYKQDERLAHTYQKRHPEDGEFSWDSDPLYIYNLIRALVYPHPGAFYYGKNGEKIIIDQFVPFDEVVRCREAHL